MKIFLFFFAATGWALGLIVHVLSLMDVNISDKAPYVWALHIGVFVVWIPTVMYLRKNDVLKELRQTTALRSINPVGSFKIFFKDAPKWLRIIAAAGFIYAVINFVLFFLSQHGGSPREISGAYLLYDHGTFLRVLTKTEYQHLKANELRGFSGHWMAFYGLAAAVLYPFRKAAE